MKDLTLRSSFKPLPILGGDPIIAPPLDLAVIRQKLANAKGPEYWRSLEELAETEEFQDFVKHEFPQDADVWAEPISRRTFLKMMGAGLSLAFFSGCRKPLELIIPYNQQPEEAVPGKPLFFASAVPFGGYARGILVENHLGRPTKIEGNPDHPDSLGATDPFMQASVLSFYDPDRSQVVTQAGLFRSWSDFLDALRPAVAAHQSKQGAGLRLLTETVTSPTFGHQLQEFEKQFPQARWHQYEPITRDALRAGARLAFGQEVETLYRFDQAEVILSLDSDFLTEMPGNLRYAREFARRRDVSHAPLSMNRLYVIETTPTITGSMADHRLPLRSMDIEAFAHELAKDLDVDTEGIAGHLPAKARDWVRVVARDLKRHTGASLVIAGTSQPAWVHALAHAMNHALGNIGRTVVYTEPIEAKPVDQGGSLRDLVQDMKAGRVDTLLILGGNHVYGAPTDLGFADAFAKVKLRVHLSLCEDETSALCHWHIPEAHPLESWGDLRAYDGTVSLIQPQIEPLYGGKTPIELLSAVLEGSPRSSHDLVHDHWQKRSHALDFESVWQKGLHDGVVAGTALKSKSVTLQHFKRESRQTPASEGLEIVFKPDPSVWDGRFANNAWLQELPKPLTKLTWDNAALVSPALAERLGISNEDVIELRFEGRAVEAPVWILPGQADQSVTVNLGYGRTRAGHVGNGTGFNAYALRSSETPWFGAGLSVRKTGKRYRLAATQHHFSMEGRDLIRVAALTDYQRNPNFAQEKTKAPAPEETLYNYSMPAKSDEYAWAMAIDLNMCNGCNACVTACQAENNIPVVGKDQVARGREMHWIRVDRYLTGDLDNPESYNQPVPCMHCENAPCEVVCPVGATVHSDEGLNQMVYNRCIGTRYCANNCSYKVRRFNFLDYTKGIEGPLKLLQNPDVTVRSRGVMEKCTYCVQRIQSSKITAEKEGRTVRDGEIVPACAQACPAKAIIFGNVLDKESAVSRKKADPRDYGLLAELGTRPRTTYQARIRNPNPEMGGS